MATTSDGYTKREVKDKIEMALRFLEDSKNKDEFYVRNPKLESDDLHGCRVCLIAAANMIADLKR